jgi:hypothetical protein
MTVGHLHLDDTPKALAIVDALLGHRGPALPGYAPDEWGADVEPELLAGSHGTFSFDVDRELAALADGYRPLRQVSR